MDKYFWYCNVCKAQNSVIDGECQYCDCLGADCKRDNCSDMQHFCGACQNVAHYGACEA